MSENMKEMGGAYWSKETIIEVFVSSYHGLVYQLIKVQI